jgi:protein TonB
MHRAGWWLFASVAWLTLSATPPAQAQNERKVLERVAPAYPDLARRANLTGLVKIEVTVRPNGTVKEARIAGGNPVLCSAAVDAVRKWKFEPAANETTEIVQLRFQPR